MQPMLFHPYLKSHVISPFLTGIFMSMEKESNIGGQQQGVDVIISSPSLDTNHCLCQSTTRTPLRRKLFWKKKTICLFIFPYSLTQITKLLLKYNKIASTSWYMVPFWDSFKVLNQTDETQVVPSLKNIELWKHNSL